MRYVKIFLIAITVAVGTSVLAFYGVTRPEIVAKRGLGSGDCDPVSADVDFGPRYDGKLIDTHIHMPDDQLSWLLPLGTDTTIGEYACAFKTEGTAQAFAFFPVHKWFMPQSAEIIRAAQEIYPEMLVPFIMPPDNDGSPNGFPTVSADVLSEMLEKAPGLFKGYGEIGLYERGDHGGPKGAPALSPDSPRMRAIYPVVREHALLVYVHLGEGQQASFERAAAANRDIKFIFHGDQLVVYENGVQDLSAINEILYRHPNVYYGVDELYGDDWLLKPEVTKEQFLAHFDNYEELLREDLATWKAFIERHPDQVLWGTDRGWFGGWALDQEVGLYLARYARAFISRLDPAVQEKFAYKNAERLLER